MKKFIKSISLIMSLCMIVVFCASCGNEEQLSFTQTLQKGMEIKEGTKVAEITLTLKTEGASDYIDEDVLTTLNMLGLDINNIKLGIKCETQYNDNIKEYQTNVFYKLGVNDYRQITDIIIKNQVFYVNIKSILTEIGSLTGQDLSKVSEYITKDYLALNQETLTSLASYFFIARDVTSFESYDSQDNSSLGIDTSSISDSQMQKITDLAKVISDALLPTVQTAIDNLGSSVISEKDGLQTVTISSGNLAEIINKFITAFSDNASSIIDKLIEGFNGLGGEYAEMSTYLSSSKEQLVSLIPTYTNQIQASITEFVNEMNSEGITFSTSLGLGFNDSTFIVKGNFNANVPDANISIEYSLNTTPGTFSGVTVPSSYYSTDELENMMAFS